MRLFYLVEEDDAERASADSLGQLAALVESDVAGRRAYQPGHGVLFHVLGHIHAHHVLLIVEQNLGERAGEFGLAHARGAEEDEAAYGALGVFQPGAGASDGVGHGGYGFVLSDHALVEPLFQAQELVRFGFQQAVNWYAGPFSDQPADTLGGYDHLHIVVAGFGAAVCPFVFESQPLRAQAGGLFVFGALGRGQFLVF